MLFPPHDPEDLAQQYEINRGRPEARSLLRFDMTPTQAGFPHVAQAAEMLRFCERKTQTDQEVEREYLLTSLPVNELTAADMLALDRKYWGVESGLHHRLDVSAGEDKSRIKTPKAAFNLSLFRRAANSFAVHWIMRQPNKRLATTTGFYDAMCAKNHQKAFSFVTPSKSIRLTQK